MVHRMEIWRQLSNQYTVYISYYLSYWNCRRECACNLSTKSETLIRQHRCAVWCKLQVVYILLRVSQLEWSTCFPVPGTWWQLFPCFKKVFLSCPTNYITSGTPGYGFLFANALRFIQSLAIIPVLPQRVWPCFLVPISFCEIIIKYIPFVWRRYIIIIGDTINDGLIQQIQINGSFLIFRSK